MLNDPNLWWRPPPDDLNSISLFIDTHRISGRSIVSITVQEKIWFRIYNQMGRGVQLPIMLGDTAVLGNAGSVMFIVWGEPII